VVEQETTLEFEPMLKQSFIAVVEDLGGQADTDGRHNLKDFVPTSSDTNVEGITPPQFEARKGGGYEEGPSKSSPDSTAPLEKDIGTLVISEGGPSRYMSNSSFARLSEQVYLRLLLLATTYSDSISG
jgi:hypothetical protein